MKTQAVLIIALMAVQAACLWETYQEFDTTDPAYIYPVDLVSGQKLRVELNWTDPSTNLDLYLYKYGADLLSNNFIFSATSTNNQL